MKTKVEIIEETANFYNINNRAFDEDFGYCMYNIPKNGKQCALGRCLVDSQDFNKQFGSASLVSIIERRKISLDNYLKEEYRGHSISFWSDLQLFHDSKSHWNETGLTLKGLKFKQVLINTHTA